MTTVRSIAVGLVVVLASFTAVATTPSRADAQTYRWYGWHQTPYYWNYQHYNPYRAYSPYTNWYGNYSRYYSRYPYYSWSRTYPWRWYW